MDDLDRQLINRLQDGIPVCERPYLQLSDELGVSEESLVGRVKALLDAGVLSRFGPMIDTGVLGGGVTLAAMQVPEEKLPDVIGLINGYDEVAHNYQREHDLNLWFVIATEKPEQVRAVIGEIEQRSGHPVYDLPKQEEYALNLRFTV